MSILKKSVITIGSLLVITSILAGAYQYRQNLDLLTQLAAHDELIKNLESQLMASQNEADKAIQHLTDQNQVAQNTIQALSTQNQELISQVNQTTIKELNIPHVLLLQNDYDTYGPVRVRFKELLLKEEHTKQDFQEMTQLFNIMLINPHIDGKNVDLYSYYGGDMTYLLDQLESIGSLDSKSFIEIALHSDGYFSEHVATLFEKRFLKKWRIIIKSVLLWSQ